MVFICEGEGCTNRLVTDPYKRYEKRIEYRDTRTNGRYAVVLVAHLCEDCVDKEVTAARPSSEQNRLAV